jgi:hypothetical protein
MIHNKFGVENWSVMEPKDHKFCPSCHLINKADAVICEHCGRPFESDSEEHLSTIKMGKATKFFPESLVEKIGKMNREAPPEGVAIYVPDQTDPIEICLEDKFIIGRLTEKTEEKVVDLTPFNAYDLGVSRRHIVIRHTGKLYNVTDLNSANGTWVNEQILLPQHPYPLNSGSQIRLGRMWIFVVFHQQNLEE